MEITEVRIKLMEDPQERLQAFCSITFDQSFVIRDLKIIEGTKGSFVAMPSRKLTDRCPQCHTKNQLRALYCNQCGARLKEDRAVKDDEGRAKLYADIAHPINSRCREMIQTEVIQAFREEQIKAQQPGYICSYDDYGEDNFAILEDEAAPRYRRTVGATDSVHRIDTPTNGSTPSPHHAVPRPASRVGSDHEEGFGSGIL